MKKKIAIIHKDSSEVEKLCKMLIENGFDALVAKNIKSCDADMYLMCKDSIQSRSVFKSKPTYDETFKTFTSGDLNIDFPSRTIIVEGREVHLTPTEFRIVTLLAKNQNTVISHEQIINEIWGPLNSDNLVLRVNMANIRRKIETDSSNPKYIHTVMGVGYYMANPL
ncbi:MAG: response regulator transcription factor [Defluviitaleaceae bacterium]|nr:response regulator transcription factor [Defluviitaleaceae bacterium]